MCASVFLLELGWPFACLCFDIRPSQFSLPLPQGGREAITKNLILREDQLPQKFLYPKRKKKVNKQVCFLLYFVSICVPADSYYFCFHNLFWISCLNHYWDYCIFDSQGDEIYSLDDFGNHVDKRAPLQPPVRKALAVFSGKRNPNDNHYSRSRH